jgi:hypothetical protein
MRYALAFGLAGTALLGVAMLAELGPDPRPSPQTSADPAAIRESFGKLGLSFIENRGQADARVKYYVQSPAHSLYFTPDGHTLRLGRDGKAHVVNVELVDAAASGIEPLQPLPGVVSYFKGPKEQWHTAIPTSGRIGYVAPWPGIDLAYDGHGGKLESIYTVAPHADPSLIRLRYSGQDSLALDDAGNLVYGTSVGQVTETAPVAYQDVDGTRVPVAARYALLDPDTVGFEVAAYDAGRALIIDPTLIYAGFIGGGGTDLGTSIAIDSAGNAYVTGSTASTEASFPIAVGPDLTQNGNNDAFIAKVSADGTTLLYAGFLGGSGVGYAFSIAVDGAGSAYVAGGTASTETTFPETVGPDLTYNGGTADGYVAKLSADGTSLVYAGYIGGSGLDQCYGIAVDGSGNAYVTGQTDSTEASFPEVGGPDLIYNGGTRDAFVAKVSADGTSLVYAGYIGGSGYDFGGGITVDGAGSAYVAGYTDSTETTFPETVGPDLTQNGDYDAFVAKVSVSGSALTYAGFIGGSAGDFANGIGVDSAGNAYVVGETSSTQATFPDVGGPDLTHNGGSDAFVAKVNTGGDALVYAGYIGGSGDDYGNDVEVDDAGYAYVIGLTDSTEATFPERVGPDLTQNGGIDAYVASVSATGRGLSYAGFIGGSADDDGRGIAVDGAGYAYVTGQTASTAATFPETGGPDLTQNGGSDAFVAKLSPPPPAGGGTVVAGGGGGLPVLTLSLLLALGLARRSVRPSAAGK